MNAKSEQEIREKIDNLNNLQLAFSIAHAELVTIMFKIAPNAREQYIKNMSEFSEHMTKTGKPQVGRMIGLLLEQATVPEAARQD